VTANTEGVLRLFFGKETTTGFGALAVGNYVAVEVNGDTVVTGYACKAGVLTTVALTPTPFMFAATLAVTSNSGTVNWYVNGTLIGSTTAGPTFQTNGSVSYEINNGATAATYAYRINPESEGD
jgi:hypothetical protein